MSNLAQLYDKNFYDAQVAGSYKSAQVYASLLFAHFTPKSVVDVGCGRGTWLKPFAERGVEKLVGIDGDWNNQSNMLDPSITFMPRDLNQLIHLDEKFDLAMSLEVAEHLYPSSAEIFVNSLTDLSNTIMFGAAFTAQGGRNHLNEQPCTYWASFFLMRNYVPFDLFRPVTWGHKDVEFWYQQNTFLYVRNDSAAYTNLLTKGVMPMTNHAFMDCVHPSLYLYKIRK